MRSRRGIPILTVVGVMLGLAGCSTYEAGYDYEPEIVELAPGHETPVASEPIRTLVSVIGVRRAVKEEATPRSVEVRLRLDNESEDQTLRVPPETLSLTSANLERFPTPITTPENGLNVPPGRQATLMALFPFPPGAAADRLNLDGLNVRWSLMIDGQKFVQSATFTRRRHEGPYYHDHPRVRFGVGVGYPYWDY